LTVKQRKRWADYFDKEGIRYTFFSAALAKERQEKEQAERDRLEALALELAEMRANNSDYTESEEEEELEEEKEEAKEDTKETAATSAPAPTEAKKTAEVSSSSKEEAKEEPESEEESESESEEDDEDEKPNKTHSHWKAIKETEKDDERTRIRDTKELYELLVKEAPVINGNDLLTAIVLLSMMTNVHREVHICSNP